MFGVMPNQQSGDNQQAHAESDGGELFHKLQ
jgi:hypothetical protein